MMQGIQKLDKIIEIMKEYKLAKMEEIQLVKNELKEITIFMEAISYQSDHVANTLNIDKNESQKEAKHDDLIWVQQ